MSSTLRQTALFAAALSISAHAHEGFLPLHEHHPDVAHGHSHAHHAHETPLRSSDKQVRLEAARGQDELRFSLATGVRHTRLSLAGERAHLWETAAGFDFAVRPWLHVGGEASYGWFDSKEGRAEGWLTPSAHIDLHLPLGDAWELTAGITVGFPGGEEALVGDHWEWTPHLELRHDRGAWFVEAGVGLAIIAGGSEEHEHGSDGGAHEEHGHEHEVEGSSDEDAHDDHHEEEEHTHAGGHGASHAAGGDFHDITDPHGERELEFHAAAGVRLLDHRLTLEGRLSGVHVFEGDTPARNYLRIGARSAWRIGESTTVSLEGSVPITDTQRNQWQVSIGVGVSF